MTLQNGNPGDAGLCPERIAKLNQTIENWVQSELTPSVVALVARHGKIVLHKAYGVLDNARGEPPLTTDAIFPLASLTKPVTAACGLLLVEDGLLDPFHPVSRYIPELTGQCKNDLLIHHLLTHTTGIDAEPVHQAYFSPQTPLAYPPCPAGLHPEVHKFLWHVLQQPVDTPPGQRMEYSGLGMVLLAEIIRRSTGQNLADLAATRIFRPLGMQDAHYIIPAEKYGRIVKRKTTDPRGEWLNSPEQKQIPAADSGMYATALDMVIFAQTLLNGGEYNGRRVFSPRGVELMITDQIPGVKAWWKGQEFVSGSWSYGWNVRGTKLDDAGCFRSARTFSHGGAGGVYLFADPQYDLVAAYFSVDVEHPVKGCHCNKELFTNLVVASVLE